MEGPIQVKPGQVLISHEKDITIHRALYDSETGSIVEMPASTHAEFQRERTAAVEAREALERAKAAEFAELLGKQRSKSVQKIIRLLLTTDTKYLRESLAKSQEGVDPTHLGKAGGGLGGAWTSSGPTRARAP